MYRFNATCDSHKPVRPPLKKYKKNAITKCTLMSTYKVPFRKVNVQFTILTTAGSDIITVIVL